MKNNDVSRKVTIAIIATLVIVSFFFPPVLLLNLPLLVFRTLYKWTLQSQLGPAAGPPASPGFSAFKISLFYTLLTGFGILLFLGVANYGERLFPDRTGLMETMTPSVSGFSDFLHVIFALVAVIIVARLAGFLFHRLKQPAVVGEVLGGIFLGPSLLGHFSPRAAEFILPPSAAPYLNIIAQLGIMLYMFIVGLELDLGVFKKSGAKTLAISHSSIMFPFLLGSGLSLFIFDRFASAQTDFMSFSLFLGVAMSITAFPVLARILTDMGLARSEVGNLALTCAAIDDVTAWCLLAFVVAVAKANFSAALLTLSLTMLYIALMFLIGRPIFHRWIAGLDSRKKITEAELAILTIGVLLSALVTELIGIHAIFGAFLFGAMIPHDSFVARDLTRRLQDLIRVLFLPAFFAFTGLRTQIGLVSSGPEWMICFAIIAVAVAGKFGGTFIAGRMTGLSTKDSSLLGVLMNTRGLVELIVLNIGLDLGILQPQLFTMMVIMALFTTVMTGPALSFFQRRSDS